MSDPVISKTTYVFEVLHLASDPPSSLRMALEEAYDGHAVGSESVMSTIRLRREDVPDELRRLGNDGTFFDEDLAEKPQLSAEEVAAIAARIPRADPANADTAAHRTTCLNCQQLLAKVPGGDGMVWVHDGTGFRFCTPIVLKDEVEADPEEVAIINRVYDAAEAAKAKNLGTT